GVLVEELAEHVEAHAHALGLLLRAVEFEVLSVQPPRVPPQQSSQEENGHGPLTVSIRSDGGVELAELAEKLDRVAVQQLAQHEHLEPGLARIGTGVQVVDKALISLDVKKRLGAQPA